MFVIAISAFSVALSIMNWKDIDDIKNVIAMIGNMAIDEELRELIKRRMKQDEQD